MTRRMERLVVALAIGRWWVAAAVLGGAVAIVALSLLLWWLLLSDGWTLLWIEVAMCIAVIIASAVLRTRCRLRVRREKKATREDWPSATAREQANHPARSADRED